MRKQINTKARDLLLDKHGKTESWLLTNFCLGVVNTSGCRLEMEFFDTSTDAGLPTPRSMIYSLILWLRSIGSLLAPSAFKRLSRPPSRASSWRKAWCSFFWADRVSKGYNVKAGFYVSLLSKRQVFKGTDPYPDGSGATTERAIWLELSDKYRKCEPKIALHAQNWDWIHVQRMESWWCHLL
jgi:hypothetical protein